MEPSGGFDITFLGGSPISGHRFKIPSEDGQGRIPFESTLLPQSCYSFENVFPKNYRYRYRLEIRMNSFDYHYRYRLGVRSHPFISICTQLPS